MLRTRMAFPAMALRLVCQVGASVAATLIASVIFAGLPKPTVPANQPVAELTSGGKFAARITGAESAASESQAAAGQRAAPPVMATAPADAVPLSAVDTAWSDPREQPVFERPARPRLHLPTRGDARRSSGADTGGKPVGIVAAVLASKPATSAVIEVGATKADDGMMPRIVSSARSLWAMTASAGGSLLSRIVP